MTLTEFYRKLKGKHFCLTNGCTIRNTKNGCCPITSIIGISSAYNNNAIELGQTKLGLSIKDVNIVVVAADNDYQHISDGIMLAYINSQTKFNASPRKVASFRKALLKLI